MAPIFVTSRELPKARDMVFDKEKIRFAEDPSTPPPVALARWGETIVAAHCKTDSEHFICSIVEPDPAHTLARKFKRRGERRQLTAQELEFLTVNEALKLSKIDRNEHAEVAPVRPAHAPVVSVGALGRSLVTPKVGDIGSDTDTNRQPTEDEVAMAHSILARIEGKES